MARMKPLAGSIETSAPAGPAGRVDFIASRASLLHAQVEGRVDTQSALEGLRRAVAVHELLLNVVDEVGCRGQDAAGMV